MHKLVVSQVKCIYPRCCEPHSWTQRNDCADIHPARQRNLLVVHDAGADLSGIHVKLSVICG